MAVDHGTAAKSCQLCFIARGGLAKVPAKCIPCYGWGKPLAWLSTAEVTGAKRRQAVGGSMIGGSDGQASSGRTPPQPPRPRRRARGRPRVRVLLAAARRNRPGLLRAGRLRQQQRQFLGAGDAELLPVPRRLRGDQHRDQELRRAERRQIQDLLPGAARGVGQSAPAAGPAAGRERQHDRHHGPRRDLGSRVRQRRLDTAVDRRRQAAGRQRDDRAGAGDRDVEGPARRGTGQHQHPAAVVPLRPGEDPAQDVGPDDRRRGAAEEGGQAALHRDPGRAVRGRDGLVQHDGEQRRRHRPESLGRPRSRWARRRSRPWRT